MARLLKIYDGTAWVEIAKKSDIPSLSGYATQQWVENKGYITSSGSCSYANTAGSAPASDVSAWAKQPNKPSYTHNEIGAGNLTVGNGSQYLNMRSGHDSYDGGIYYSTPGNEAMVFAAKNSVTSFIFKSGLSCTSTSTSWQTLTPDLQIKNGKVTINKLIANDADGSYNLDVNGTMNATTIYQNGSSLENTYLGKTSQASDSAKLNGQEASYYLNYNNLSNRPSIPSSASDVNALPSSTKYGASLSASGTSVSLKDQDGTVLSTITTQDTTYESLSASSGNSSVSLCTRGEKYTWNNKQAALVSGSNIKTINGTSILGSGNISISGAGWSTALYMHTINFQINMGGAYFGAASITYVCEASSFFVELYDVAYYMSYTGPNYDDDLPYVGLIPASGFVYNVSHKYTVYGACYKYKNGSHYIRLAAVTESGAVEYLDVNDNTLMGNSVVTDQMIRIN